MIKNNCYNFGGRFSKKMVKILSGTKNLK